MKMDIFLFPRASASYLQFLSIRGLFFPTCKLTCTFTCNVSRILHNDRKNLKFCQLMIHKISGFYAHYNKFYIVLQVRFLDFHSGLSELPPKGEK